MGGRQERRRARISAWLMINSRPLIATLLACNIFITGAYAYLTTDGDPTADASGVRKNMEDRIHHTHYLLADAAAMVPHGYSAPQRASRGLTGRREVQR